ncbi:uncharacterized protein E0L32_010708 [Thyridium curvatum]|uniref:Protein kinase domain-containing protein n=1 Tax=Thyridium curvatum TaxID=1093900 RepID=A0A507ARU2_9PEZI|nr:uncharacterized protein E0L32_010708 [Thyridium curvatum]TPX07609.1 hypothetical protein E0L32_010708 [Thyridium curvatum]
MPATEFIQDNFLVHETEPDVLDLWLCDFGGSTCEELGLDGKHLPDPGFFDPSLPWESQPMTDIFSIGSLLYSILTGHWPFREPGLGSFKTTEECDSYRTVADQMFNVDGILGGDVISGCGMKRFKSAEEVLQAWDLAVKTMAN